MGAKVHERLLPGFSRGSCAELETASLSTWGGW